VFDPLVLFVILLFVFSRSSLPPIGGPNALGVYMRIAEVGIWLGVLWRSLLLVDFRDVLSLSSSDPIYFLRGRSDGDCYLVWCLYVSYMF